MPRPLVHSAYSNAYLLLSLTALFWAGNFVLGRGIAGHVPPIALSFLRWAFATLVILPFAWRSFRRDWPVIRHHLPILFFLGAAGGGSFNTIQYIGLNHTTAINALLLNSSAPILIAIACVAFFGDRLSWRQIVGITVSLIGVLAIVIRGEPMALSALAFNKGDIWVLSGMVIWAIYTAFLRKRPDIHWLSFSLAIYFFSALVTLPLFVWEHFSGPTLQPTLTTFLAVAYASIFPSIIAYIFYNRGVELIGGSRAGAFMHLIPLFGSVLALALLGETMRPYHFVGFALILAGVTLAVRAR